MAEQKSVVSFREHSRDVLAYWLADRKDQLAFLTLGGVAYTKTNNGATRVGSGFSQLEFAADVAAPSNKRVAQWDASTGLMVGGATTDLTAGDVPTWKMLVDLKAYAKEQYIRGIKAPGGKEIYRVFFTPTGVATLKKDTEFQNALRNAGTRGNSNEFFTGDMPTVDGLDIHEHRHVPNTMSAASGSKYGASSTLDGCQVLFCGAQALAMADIGDAIWVEKGFDFENSQAIAFGKIFGLLKPKFHSIFAGSVQDFGVISTYVVYK
jgi:N4-gp56 family major capsid protein